MKYIALILLALSSLSGCVATMQVRPAPVVFYSRPVYVYPEPEVIVVPRHHHYHY